MSFSYDFNTNAAIATVRLLVFDTSNVPPLPIWQDEEIQGALNMFSSQGIIQGLSGYQLRNPVPLVYSYRRAAAVLLRGLAANRAQQSVIGLLDVKLSGNQASAALNKIAADYITSEENDGYFSVSEMVQNQFSMRERLYKMALRRLND